MNAVGIAWAVVILGVVLSILAFRVLRNKWQQFLSAARPVQRSGAFLLADPNTGANAAGAAADATSSLALTRGVMAATIVALGVAVYLLSSLDTSMATQNVVLSKDCSGSITYPNGAYLDDSTYVTVVAPKSSCPTPPAVAPHLWMFVTDDTKPEKTQKFADVGSQASSVAFHGKDPNGADSASWVWLLHPKAAGQEILMLSTASVANEPKTFEVKARFSAGSFSDQIKAWSGMIVAVLGLVGLLFNMFASGKFVEQSVAAVTSALSTPPSGSTKAAPIAWPPNV